MTATVRNLRGRIIYRVRQSRALRLLLWGFCGIAIPACGGGSTPGRPPAAFLLTSPANGATQLSLTPQLNWTASTRHDTYTVQIASDAAFTTILLDVPLLNPALTAWTVAAGSLSAGTPYFWRVSAVNTVGTTAATNGPFSFTTNSAPDSSGFQLMGPTNGSTNHPKTPTLSWSDASGETSYTVEISTSAGFGTLTYENSGLSADTTSFPVPAGVLSESTTYYWRVKAVNNVAEVIAPNAPFTLTTLTATPVSNTWTWMSGSTATGQQPTYGTKGVGAASSVPGARQDPYTWIDAAGNFWLFGGKGYDSTGTFGLLNDLWRFDGMVWTWVGGSTVADQSGVYGTKGVADPGNWPGARQWGNSWVDTTGNFWLFGGLGYAALPSSGSLNDVWKFDGSQWTWMSGSNSSAANGVYGTQGVADPANAPGARHFSASCRDAAGNFFVFGGTGYDATNAFSGKLNDLWKFDGASWTWLSGSTLQDAAPVYGTKGVADPSNIPGCRERAMAWADAAGAIWIFGGAGRYSLVAADDLNDLWKFNGAAWTWIAGSDVGGQDGIYGTKGTPDPANVPGARVSSACWIDPSGNLWLFGGAGDTFMSDLWKFDGTSWAWISGPTASTLNQHGIYGTRGVGYATNNPGGRLGMGYCSRADGFFWVFGGLGFGSTGAANYLNDLWRYAP